MHHSNVMSKTTTSYYSPCDCLQYSCNWHQFLHCSICGTVTLLEVIECTRYVIHAHPCGLVAQCMLYLSRLPVGLGFKYQSSRIKLVQDH